MNNSKSVLDLLEQKIYNAINNQLKKCIIPNLKLQKVTDIDLQLVKKLKSEYGIGGIILDVDETIRKNMMDIPDCNKKWIQFMKQEFKVIILSNGYDKKIEEFSKENNLKYLSFATKPLKGNFLKACDNIGLNPENVLLIGDDIVADIYGGNRCGLITAIVETVTNQKEDVIER